MGGCSTVRKRKPRANAKFITNIFTEEDLQDRILRPYKGLIISLKRAEITKIDKEFSDKYYSGKFIGQYEIYCRDWNFFLSKKDLKIFKEEYA